MIELSLFTVVSHLCCLLSIKAESFEYPYLDYLQSPLQPLRDNLESQTYETFERDPVKYAQYEEAIYQCLSDRVAAGKTRHVVMVVGAGRGPLVAASLKALRRANVDKANYHMIAIEKNMNAVITLRWDPVGFILR